MPARTARLVPAAPRPRLALAGLAAIAAVALTGCGAGSGILAVGPDTYSVAEMRAPVLGGGAEARRVVLAEMDMFCRQQGRVVLPVAMAPDGDPFTPYWPTGFGATFRCVAGVRPEPGAAS